MDVNRLQKAGCLRPGCSGIWQWTEDGKQVAWIQLRAEERHLRFSYRIRIGHGDWEDVDEPVQIVRVPCRLGGSRPYFVCPGIVNGIPCRGRVAKLYGAGRYFLCRHCYSLTYSSQSEDVLDRTWRRANKIRRRLGGELGSLSRFPDRPKGMWEQTYDRLRAHAIRTEVQADEMFEVQSGRLLARIEGRCGKGSFWS